MRLSTLCASIVALTALASPLSAEVKPKNAALEYWPLFAQMEGLPEADLKIIDNWQTAPLDEKVARIVAVAAPNDLYRYSFQHLHAGAQAETCDWGLDFSQGPFLLLPHLNYGRRLAQRGCLRIRYDVQQKRFGLAVEDTRDVIMLGRNLAQDPIVVCKLVRFGIEQIADETIAVRLNEFDADGLKRLLAMLDQLPKGATEVDTVRFELQIANHWMIREIAAAGDHPNWGRILGFFERDNSRAGAAALQLVKAAGGTPESVTSALRSLEPYYTEMEELVATPMDQKTFQEKNDALRHRFDANPLAKAMLPNFQAFHDADAAAETRIALLKLAVDVIAHGPDATQAFRDPVNHQPIQYERVGKGFRLTTKVTSRGEPVTLSIGGAK